MVKVSKPQKNRNENMEEEHSSEEKSNWETCFKKITVEPVIFFYAFGIILNVPVIQQYIHKRISESKGFTFNTNVSFSDCKKIPSTRDMVTIKLEKEVQSESSYMQLGLVFSASAPSLFIALILGAWSDHVGRRKIMGLPIFGSTIQSSIVLIVIYLNLPIQTLLLAGFIEGLCGFFPTMILSVFSYIADITDESERAFRLGVLEAVAFVSGMLSHLTSGWWIHKVGYRAPYWLILSLHTIALFYVVVILPESQPRLLLEQSDFKVLRYIRDVVSVFTKPRPEGRLRMCILMLSSGLMIITSVGFGCVIVLYALDRPLCLNSIMIGYFLATSFFVQAVGALLGLRFLGLILSEHSLMQVGIMSVTLSLITMAFVSNRRTLFIVPFIACLGGIPTPVIRAMMSKVVDSGEQGALFAAVATLETFCTLLGALIFNSIYPLSLRLGMKGFCFLVMALIMMAAFILIEIVKRMDYKRVAQENNPNVQNEEKVGFEWLEKFDDN